MEKLIIEASTQTPSVSFDHETGQMEIIGRSIPDQPDKFWGPVLTWFDAYLSQPSLETTVKINLDYFNIPSSKRILFLLYKLNELSDSGYKVKVEWHYKEADGDMYEVGQDYAYMVKVPFEFKEIQQKDLVLN